MRVAVSESVRFVSRPEAWRSLRAPTRHLYVFRIPVRISIVPQTASVRHHPHAHKPLTFACDAEPSPLRPNRSRARPPPRLTFRLFVVAWLNSEWLQPRSPQCSVTPLPPYAAKAPNAPALRSAWAWVSVAACRAEEAGEWGALSSALDAVTRGRTTVIIAAPPDDGRDFRRGAGLRCREPRAAGSRMPISTSTSVCSIDRGTEDEVVRLLGLSAARVDVGQGAEGNWEVMADPEGNELCVLRTLASQRAATAGPWARPSRRSKAPKRDRLSPAPADRSALRLQGSPGSGSSGPLPARPCRRSRR